jgi:poly-gamma-glutamate capsule biosynthesis protein CapA/YwtB (metallophosphatase superfamily)
MGPEPGAARPGRPTWRETAMLPLGLALGLGVIRLLPPPQPPPPEPPPPTYQATLVAVGDIMMHQDVKRSAEAFGFDHLWAEVSPLLKAADVAFGNLETPVAPAGGRPGVPFVFNAPAELPQALVAAGWTFVSTANNHAFDQGPKGIRETLERLDAVGLGHAGSGITRAEAEAPRILERNGLRIALLAFTDIFNVDLNGKPDAPWVRPLDLADALPAIQAVRPQVDAVVVSVHWGNEYQHQPSPRQREAARQLVAAGADVILGHHPHVLQPVAWVEAEGRRALVAFSLGNFISNQDRTWRPGMPVPAGDNRDGALVRVRLAKGRAGALEIQGEVEPLWTENSWGRPGPRVIRVRRVNPQGAATPEEQAAFTARHPRIRAIIGSEWVMGAPEADPALRR